MFRVRLIVTIAVIAMALVLAGCSGSSLSSYVPDWLQFKPSPPPTQALQFESQPPGAEVRGGQGQTCLTPCSLAVPVANQPVTFALNGFVPQTVQVEVGPSGDLTPNPVDVALQPVPPPIRPVRKPPRKRPPPRTAARPAPPPPGPAPVQNTPGFSTPLQQPTVQPPPSSPFPPPPQR